MFLYVCALRVRALDSLRPFANNLMLAGVTLAQLITPLLSKSPLDKIDRSPTSGHLPVKVVFGGALASVSTS